MSKRGEKRKEKIWVENDAPLDEQEGCLKYMRATCQQSLDLLY